jgi:thiol-disulfide isomerase/thioredoxin
MRHFCHNYFAGTILRLILNDTMKKIIFAFLVLICAFGARAQNNIPAYSAEDIIKRTSSKDTLYIINFWATWCVPCVRELPQFNALQRQYAGKPVKILMVSLDFKEDYPTKLAAFIGKKKLTPEVAWLSDTDPNVFIPKIDPSWQGSIPATVVVHPGKGFKKFIEGTITDREISRIISSVMGK